jgi:hypothetical protein
MENPAAGTCEFKAESDTGRARENLIATTVAARPTSRCARRRPPSLLAQFVPKSVVPSQPIAASDQSCFSLSCRDKGSINLEVADSSVSGRQATLTVCRQPGQDRALFGQIDGLAPCDKHRANVVF